ncbi:MAG: tetratricopeptide repeat protein [Candidatus Lokiarchaeota archaeon]|nr:tetratricopeptide repeat protein [Candidatus Lokiarchaeota archaeon]
MSDFLKKFMDLAARNSKLDKLIEDCNEKLKINPNSIDFLSQLMEAYNLIGQHKKAINIGKEILDLNQSYRPALNNIFYAYDRLENFDQALIILKKYIETFPLYKNKKMEQLSFSLILYNHFKENKSEPMLEIYLPPNYPSEIIDLNFGSSFHCSKIGWSLRSSEVLKIVLDKYPHDIDLWNALGYSYLSIEKYEDAKNAFDKAIEIDDENQRTRYLLGSLHLKEGNYKKAENELVSILNQSSIKWEKDFPLLSTESPDDNYQNLSLIPGVLTNLGQVYNKIGEYEKAIEKSNKALALTKSLYPSVANIFRGSSRSSILAPNYENLGVAYYALDNIKMAIKAFKKALRNVPENIVVLEYLGQVYFDIGKYKLASEVFKNIVGLKPEDVQAWYLLSKSYYQNKKLSYALEANTRCLTLDPNFKPALELRDQLS